MQDLLKRLKKRDSQDYQDCLLLLLKLKTHEEEYLKLLANVEGEACFKRQEKQVWVCSNCGHIVVAEAAPEKCPVCDHAKAYFQIKAENF